MGGSRTHSCCGICLPRTNGYLLCHCSFYLVRIFLMKKYFKPKVENVPECFLSLCYCPSVYILIVLGFCFNGSIIISNVCLTVPTSFRDTPVVKSSSRELCYIILAGICLGYLCTFTLIAKPHVIHCYLQRLGIGLSPAMSYSALVTKVRNRTEPPLLPLKLRQLCRNTESR